MASFQSLLARPQSVVMFLRASQINFEAASSEGKCPLVLMILRSRAFTLSMALVVRIDLFSLWGHPYLTGC